MPERPQTKPLSGLLSGPYLECFVVQVAMNDKECGILVHYDRGCADAVQADQGYLSKTFAHLCRKNTLDLISTNCGTN